MKQFKNPVDRYLTAATEARDLARTHAERLQPMKTETGDTLNFAAQKALYDKHYAPLLAKGDVPGALKLVSQQAPLGSDYEKELQRLVKTFGSE